jgi:hypothetical protein
MTFYEIRIEPKKYMNCDEVRRVVEEAFAPYGGLSTEGVEILNWD